MVIGFLQEVRSKTVDRSLVRIRLRMGCQAEGHDKGWVSLTGAEVVQWEQGLRSLPSRIGFTCIFLGPSCASLPDYPILSKSCNV